MNYEKKMYLTDLNKVNKNYTQKLFSHIYIYKYIHAGIQLFRSAERNRCAE